MRIAYATAQNHNKFNECPSTGNEPADYGQRKDELGDATTRIAQVEIMDSQSSKEEGQQGGGYFRLGRHRWNPRLRLLHNDLHGWLRLRRILLLRRRRILLLRLRRILLLSRRWLRLRLLCSG